MPDVGKIEFGPSHGKKEQYELNKKIKEQYVLN